VALALPRVVVFDLSIPAQVFGHSDERQRYSFAVCAAQPGPVPSTTGFAVHARLGLAELARADTVIVPGYAPHDAPSPAVLNALRRAAGRGARMVSVCTGAFAGRRRVAGRPSGRDALAGRRRAGRSPSGSPR